MLHAEALSLAWLRSLAAGSRESDAITEDDIFPKQFVLLGLLSQRRRSTMELGAANSYGHAQQHSVHTNATKPLPTLVMCLLSAIATNTIHAPLNAGTAAQSQLQPLGVWQQVIGRIVIYSAGMGTSPFLILRLDSRGCSPLTVQPIEKQVPRISRTVPASSRASERSRMVRAISITWSKVMLPSWTTDVA